MSNTGTLNLEGCYTDMRMSSLDLEQIYSPSRLYSLLPTKKMTRELSPTVSKLFVLNNASLTINKYSITGVKEIKLNYIYWLADFLLVGVTQEDDCLIQTTFLVDHENHVIVKDRERRHSLNPGKAAESHTMIFSERRTTVVVHGNDFIVWPGHRDENRRTFWIFLLPRNSLLDLEVKEFSIRIPLKVFIEIRDLFNLEGRDVIGVGFPSASQKSSSLCRVGIFNADPNLRSLDIFGVFVCYDMENLVDLHGKEEYDELEVQLIQESSITLFLLPCPKSLTFNEFHRFVRCEVTTTENCLLMASGVPEKSKVKIELVNFNTLDYQTITIEFEGYHYFSVHPDGFAILWEEIENKLNFKKVYFPRSNSSLQDLTRRHFIMNGRFNPLTVPGLKTIVFPGSELVFKVGHVLKAPYFMILSFYMYIHLFKLLNVWKLYDYY